MTKEEILKRIIEKEIPGDQANRIIYNSFLFFSWLEALTKRNEPDLFILLEPIFTAYKEENFPTKQVPKLTAALTEEGLFRKGMGKKAQKDNIIFFPPWGIPHDKKGR